MVRTQTAGTLLLLVGAALALVSGVLLGYFLLTDGHTLRGQEFRGDPEFQRYWMVNLVPFALGLGLAWIDRRVQGSR